MPSTIAFAGALEKSEEFGSNRHLLLGNGFSIACRPKCFSYGRLLDEADLDSLSVDGHALFTAESTTDFEEVIAALRVAARLAEFYETADLDLAARLQADAEVLKDVLAVTLAAKHPDNVGDIEPHEYEAARAFLFHFRKIFTVSYDLLLYWALMQDMEPTIKNDDGFRQDRDAPDAEWVSWDSYRDHSRNVYYLHGGLHLLEEGPTLKKLTFSRTGVALITQIRDALEREAYPLVVTEGSSAEKHARIRHNDYLSKGLRSLAPCGGSLFVHGHSLAENDAHVYRAIGRNACAARACSPTSPPTSRRSPAALPAGARPNCWVSATTSWRLRSRPMWPTTSSPRSTPSGRSACAPSSPRGAVLGNLPARPAVPHRPARRRRRSLGADRPRRPGSS